ncbi:exportin ellipsoid body open [Rhynchophorus ferrugineus]|uniref:exportin ellipsoid body open n=1 Tax=Rhynchophorus ferrugineus TaxID=354439 RepID=UPI003FCCEFE8
MDFNENGSLVAIENLFEEFFNPCTSNLRKHEIEVQLSAIRTVPHLGKLCLYFITHTSSHYVTMFALQTLEAVISQQWFKTDWTVQDEIKSLLLYNLIYKGNNAPCFLRNKYAKLLVDIARIDWPTRYPNFFTNIIELLKSDDANQLTGLILLKTTCEEFMSINSTFENLNRKKELTRLLHSYIPIVFELLTNIIEKIGTKSKYTATATPPPSPTNPSTEANIAGHLNGVEFRPDIRLLGQEVLTTIQYLFGWVSIEEIPRKLIKAIFSLTNFSIYSLDDDDLSVRAISTINEIFYRKCCPPGSENFFHDIYNDVVELLRNITSSGSYHIDPTDETFASKLTELLILLIEQHMWRFEENPNFSSLEFLSLFFQYMMHLPEIVGFLRCLNVWSIFFKQIKSNNTAKYSEVFVGLGSALVKKIQFSYNFAQLVEVNMVDVDEDNKTEWQYLILSAVDIVVQAARYAPLDIFNQILNSWNMYNSEYNELVKYSLYTHNSSNTETDKLTYILRDFSTLTFTLASLAHHFYPKENESIHRPVTPLICALIENTLKSASVYNKLKSYLLRVNNPKLTQSFIDAQSELLASLKTWLGWMEARNEPINTDANIFLEIIIPFLREGGKVPNKISLAAAQLFLEMSRRPGNLCPSQRNVVAEFLQETPRLKYGSSDIRDTVNSAVCDILLRHLKSFDQETVQRYKLLIGIFFDGITSDFKELTCNSTEAKVCSVVVEVLPALSHVIEYCRGFPIIAKRELTSAIKTTLDHALVLFPTYMRYTEVHNIFSKFFISVLKNLQSQIGSEFTKNAIQVFLQVAISEQQANSLSGIQQLLDIFCMVVRETTNKSFLPDILQLCMENIYTLLLPQAGDNPDVFTTFLDLLYNILNFHWLYFYNSQVMLGYSPGGSDSEVGPDVPKRPDQLLAVLKVFGEALLLDDINIFRRSLAILQDLNQNKKLYHKSIFRNHLLPELLRVLLNTLLYKRQALCNDDIILAVYHMAEVDFNGFFLTYLPQYVQNLEGITPREFETLMTHFTNSSDRDIPSFMQHLQNFATEFQHFRMCNNS